MDIFKLGDKIITLLEAEFVFENNQIISCIYNARTVTSHIQRQRDISRHSLSQLSFYIWLAIIGKIVIMPFTNVCNITGKGHY